MAAKLSLLALTTLAATASAQTQIDVNDWIVPYPGPQAYVANVGDTIVFNWGGQIPHNVLIHPTMNCDTEGAVFIGAQSGSSYTFAEADGSDEGTEHFFACDVSWQGNSHCQGGQNLIVKVFNSGANSGVADDAGAMDMSDAEPAADAAEMEPEPAAAEMEPAAPEPVAEDEPAEAEPMADMETETESAEAADDSAGAKLSLGAFAVAASVVGTINLF